ncbi:peptide deformylase, partial [Collinsella sp.]|uniref:peptide deformylase n=1 Tax=Collinsella sp. TaxID=1965294 RepID=UPI003FF01E6D
MEINGIVLSPDPRLRQECAEVEEINSDLRALVERMKVQMFENGGCGLAAPQVGETIQLAIVDTEYTSEKDYDPYVLINPVIVEQSDNLVPYNEGCLSIPGINCEISRPDHVVVEASNREG